MSDPLLLNISALLALLPLTLVSWRHMPAQGPLIWLLTVVAIAGPGILLLLNSADGWRTDLSTSIWITIFACLLVYSIICGFIPVAWQIANLTATYMFILGVFAMIWSYAGTTISIISTDPLSLGIIAHISVSVATYALVTLAAVASLAAVLQERALKAKQISPLIRGLPSLADCDRLVMRLLLIGEAILALGLMSGMALQFEESKALFVFDHKTLLSVTAFVVIGGLLIAHFNTGLRGRKAARVVLLGYLLLTLGYPGVKFVTDVLLVR